MIIDGAVLDNFRACEEARNRFVSENPHGFDVSGLYGTEEQRRAIWSVLVAAGWSQHFGWAISEGLLPARLPRNLCGADLRWADLRWANWNKHTQWPEGFVPPAQEAD